MVVSLVALFMSMGGVGYAAISLPANSVGTAQLRNNAVTYKKIVPNTVGAVRLADNGVTNSKIRNGAVSYQKIQARAVGRVRANLDQLQARLTSACAAGTAIGGVDAAGTVTCNSARPAQVGVADKPAVTVPAPVPPAAPAQVTVNSLSLPAGASYLVFANPSVSVTGSGTAQRVTVSCALAVGGVTQSRSVTIDTGTLTEQNVASIPLQLAGPAGVYSVSCSAAVNTGSAQTVNATSAINALQTAG